MIQTQTFEFSKTAKDEMIVIASALSLLAEKRYDEAVKVIVIASALRLISEKRHDEAAKVLIARHDELTRDPETKLYDQRKA